MSSYDPAADQDPADIDSRVAVVGMAARYPQAPNVERYWENLCAGVESVSVIEEGTGEGGTVTAYGVLEGADEFDNEFFGYSPREALIIDPQHRVLLECAYHALEDAGCDPQRTEDVIGIYAGGSTTPYPSVLLQQLDQLPSVDEWQIRVATGPDFLATRVAYKLRLTGPAVTVQTACSTSLVAVHTAAQALLAGECDVALAGGVSVRLPLPRNTYREGGVFSPDGHLRAFDAEGRGIVGGSGAGVVVLKPLGNAIDDGDHIHAVLLGSAVNNDGAAKIGFTAPSVEGQAQAVRAAQQVAGVPARSITYIETHGTGTPLGDPIEVAALAGVYPPPDGTQDRCWLGSAKTNIGHTDAAAGAAGFIKAALAVEHGVIPPSLNFTTPNPQIDFESTPFRVNTILRPWQPTGHPRRAGVSALGVGGTNAHVVIEEPPSRTPVPREPGRQLLPLSARSTAALEEMTGLLGEHLARQSEEDLADTAWTLQTGRPAHRHRAFLVGEDAADSARVLSAGRHRRLVTGEVPQETPDVVFTFPGQGGQHVGMTRELYATDPGFRADVDECAAWALPLLGRDLREVLYPKDEEQRIAAERALSSIDVGQPAVFVVEYALARLWQRWGVRPSAVAGHSLGAYAAACVAGVFSLEDAVALAVRRGRLLQGLPAGSMAAVGLPESEVLPLLPEGLDIGAVNSPDQVVVSGPSELVERFVRDFPRPDVEVKPLKIATAGHSALVEPVLEEFESFLAGITFRRPTIPVVSDTTGQWADPEQITTPAYWRAHMRQAVRFSDVLTVLGGTQDRVLLEVGPGLTLTSLARRHPATGESHLMLQSLPHPADPTPETSILLTAAGRLWTAGIELDWAELHGGRPRFRTKLPAYPFQRRSFLVRPPARPAWPGTPSEAVDPPAQAGPPSVRREAPPVPVDDADAEDVVSAAFREVLGVTDVDPHTSFFDLGGDSVIAAALVAWIRRSGLRLTVLDVFAAPSPAELADRLREAGRTRPASV